MLQLVTSNYFSVLYYNSEVWHLHSLKQFDKNQLLTASSKALMLATHYKYPMLCYKNLHQINNRCTPEMYCNYKLALLLLVIQN
jgi:hypothetical protein